MSEKDLFKQMMAEYFHDTLQRCEYDVINVKNDIILHASSRTAHLQYIVSVLGVLQ